MGASRRADAGAGAEADADAAPSLVVLAAGASSRMGEPKGLVVVRGRPWIDRQLDAAQSAGVRRVVVVLGRDRERYLEAVPSLAQRATIAVNHDPDRGPFSSIQCGLRALGAEEPPAAFVLPVDVPAASAEVWRALAAALLGDSSVHAAVPVHGGRGGHPVLLSSPLAARLLSLPPGDRLDHALGRPGVAVARVPVADPRVRLNLNRPEDWGTLKQG